MPDWHHRSRQNTQEDHSIRCKPKAVLAGTQTSVRGTPKPSTYLGCQWCTLKSLENSYVIYGNKAAVAGHTWGDKTLLADFSWKSIYKLLYRPVDTIFLVSKHTLQTANLEPLPLIMTFLCLFQTAHLSAGLKEEVNHFSALKQKQTKVFLVPTL